MTGSILANEAPLGGGPIGSTRNVRRLIRQRQLQRIGAGSPPTDPPFGPQLSRVASSGTKHWLGRAWRALARGDYQQAAYAAGMARRYGDTAQAAALLARADAGLGLFEDAVIEAQRAVRLAPAEPEHHLTLAGIFADLGNWTEALRCYRIAERLDPRCDAARIGRALVLAQTGDTQSAERILEAVYADTADKATVGDCLSLVLIEAAEQIPRVRTGETYLITSAREVASMRTKLARAAAVTSDPELRACVTEVRSYVETCARRGWLGRRLLRSYTGRTYLAVLAIISCGVIAVAFLGNQPMLLLAAALPISRIAYDLLRHVWVPRWKLNRWAHEREDRQALVR